MIRLALTKSVGAALAGFIFSALLSAAIVLGLYFRLGPMLAVERAGIDASFRLLATFPELNSSIRHASHVHPKIVFLDVDARSCVMIAAAAECRRANPVRPELVRAVMGKLLNTPARAIVIDARFDLDRDEDRKLLDEIVRSTSGRTSNSGPLIIIPIDIRPENALASKALAQSTAWAYQATSPRWLDADFQRALAKSRVRLVPSLIMNDAVAGDGIIRTTPRYVAVGDGDIYWHLPNLPYLLARIGQANSKASVDCTYFDCAQTTTLPLSGTRDETAPPEPAVPIRYTIPSLSLEYDERCQDLDPTAQVRRRCGLQSDRFRRFAPVYSYERMSRLLSDGDFDYDAEAARDGIIIIGSSLPSANDIHHTPLGAMPGPEVLANAILTFATKNDAIQPHSINMSEAIFMLIGKVWAAVPASLLLVTATFCAIVIDGVLRKKSERWRRNKVFGRLLAACLIILALAVSISLDMLGMLDDLYSRADRGLSSDTLTPILALLLERYAEVAKALMDRLEHTGKVLAMSGWKLSQRIVKIARTGGRT